MKNPEPSYDRALDYLYSFVDYSLKHSSELAKAEFNLDRMRKLMAALGDPQSRYAILHVAGTKGKGSVCALAASGLRAAGHRVGLYTSPHLLDYCERIQVNGVPVSHAALVKLIERAKPAVERIPKLTTFEITTALGLLHFADEQVDVAVVEVGLGGRLDATNVVQPKVTVITSLSYDHMAVLGDTLAKIAAEKAGIIKAGVPLISAPQHAEALEVLEHVATGRNAALTLVGREIKVEPLEHTLDGQSMQLHAGGVSLTVSTPLLGGHQTVNAATAAAALWEMRRQGIPLTNEALARGFAEVKWPARFEIARREPPVIFDSAHNQDSFAWLRQSLDDYFPGLPAYLVFGASEDKNIPGMFAEIRDKLRCMFITRADHPRALAPQSILPLAAASGIRAELIEPVEAAFERALRLSEKDGSIVLSAGSMFVTAEAMAAWQARESVDARQEP